MSSVPGFDRFDFEALGKRRPVFVRGEGIPVVLCHELPGLTRETVDLAERLVADGFRIYLPLLFGDPLQRFSRARVLLGLPQLCLRHQFHCFARSRSSPVADWLRELCRWVSATNDGRRVGAVGMCLTGGFVLVMMIDPSVGAVVLSQPALPFRVLPGSAAALGVSEADLERAKARGDVPLLGLRFSSDERSPCQRFATLQGAFGGRFEAVTLRSPDPDHDISARAHSVLVYEYDDREGHPTRDAYLRVVSFLRDEVGEPLPREPEA